MLEHIFRNINDIRVFDLMNDFDENCDITFDDVLELLEYTETERVQIEDSTGTRYERIGKLSNGKSITIARSLNVETI